MKEDSFVSTDNGTGERADDECSSDGSDEHSVNTVEEGEASDKCGHRDDSETTEESEGSERGDESGDSDESDDESGTTEDNEGSEASDDSETADESGDSDESDDESGTTEDNEGSEASDDSETADESGDSDESDDESGTTEDNEGSEASDDSETADESDESDENKGSEASDESGDSDESDDESETTDESDGGDETEETDGSDGSGESQTTDESDGGDETEETDRSDGSGESQTTDESDETDRSDGSDRSDRSDESQTTDESDGGDETEETDRSDGHLAERCPGTRGSGGDSTTLTASGPFKCHDSDDSSDPASVANKHSLERPSKLHFDGWMPSMDARVSTQGNKPTRQRPYPISRRRSSAIKKKLTRDTGRKLRRRDGDCLRGIKLQDFHVQNIAVGGGSFSVLGWLDNEKEPSIWTRTVLAEAWGTERADQLLNFYLSFYLKQARARRLPNNKRRKIQQGGNGSILNWDKEFEELKVRVEGGKQ